MGKHICKNLEWDDLIPMATAAYTFFPHTPSKERPLFLMFGQDPLGEGNGKLDLTTLQNTYQLAAQNVQMAREKSKVDESSIPPAFQLGDLVTLRDHMAKAFDPKYMGEYRVIKFLGKTQVLLRNSKGEETKHHMAYLKKTYPAQETIRKIPDFKRFGRADKVPDLKWDYEATETKQVAEISEIENHKQVQEAARILILHLCYKYICSAKSQRNLKNLIRCYRVSQCIHKARIGSTSMHREYKAISLMSTVICRTMCT